MLDAQAIQLMHLHDDRLVPLNEVHDNPDRHDEERDWLRGMQIYRCGVCEGQVIVQKPQGSPKAGAEGK